MLLIVSKPQHPETKQNNAEQYRVKKKNLFVFRVRSSSEAKYSILENNVRRYLRYDTINDVKTVEKLICWNNGEEIF